MLLLSLRLGDRRPDEEHPFGHGTERFFWAFLAAVVIFLSGALFSIGEGVLRLLGLTSGEGSWVVAVIVLAVSFVAEGISLIRASRQTRAEAEDAGVSWRDFVRESSDPTAKFVVFEDAAAVAGIVIAFVGVVASAVTGSEAWDGAASIVIGLLLALVAVRLGRDMRGLLLGRGATPATRERIRDIIEAHPGVDEVVDLRTLYLGPRSLLVASRVDLDAGVDGDGAERLATEIARDLREQEPDVAEVFLDPTRAGEADPA
jgi:cation diffusion facilitator family transporter